MAYGTDMNIYGVKIMDDIDSVTLVQAFGEYPQEEHVKIFMFRVIAPLKSFKIN